MNIINPKVLSDIEFHSIYPKINKTITVYGNSKLQSMLRINDIENIHYKRDIILKAFNNKTKRTYIRKKLKLLANMQKDIGWLFHEEEIPDIYKDMYFKFNCFNSSTLLNLSNNFSIALPFIYVCIYVVLYLILNCCNIKINIKDYFLMLYKSYKSFSLMVVSLFINNEHWASFIGNLIANSYTIFTLYSTYSFFNKSYQKYLICSQMKNKFKKIKESINIIKDINDHDFLFNKQLCKKINQKINKIHSLFESNNIGDVLFLFKHKKSIEKTFNNILQHIGSIDAYLSISLLLQEGYCLPEFIMNDSPSLELDIKNLWHPALGNKQVINNIKIQNDKKKILSITGCNRSGKTTFMKSMTLAILLAQTIGVSNCSSISSTPFDTIFTLFEIPNSVEKCSLFEMEVSLYTDIFNYLIQNKNKKCFIVSDELLTCTNNNDSNALTYAIYNFLNNQQNVISVISTHNHQMVEKCSNILNLHCFKNNTFKLSPGISKQSSLISTISNIGINKQVILDATNYFDN